MRFPSVVPALLILSGSLAAADVQSVTALDINADGNIDTIRVAFTDLVTIVDGNANDALPGVTVAAATVVNGDHAGTGVSTLDLPLVTSLPGSAATPVVSVGLPAVSLTLGTTTKTAVDGARPVCTAAVTRDIDANGLVDQIQMTFSEALAGTTNIQDWSISNGSTTFGLLNVTITGTSVTLDLRRDQQLLGNDLPSVTYNPTLALADAAGNSLQGFTKEAIDGVAPRLLSITSSLANTRLKAGSTIPFTLKFSEPVTLLVPGAATAKVSFNNVAIPPDLPGLSATDTVNGNLVVGAADSGTLGLSSIVLAGGATLRDAAASPLDYVGQSSTFVNGLTNIVLDTTGPAISSYSTRDQNVDGFIDTIVANFNSPVDFSSVAASDFSVQVNGTAVPVTAISQGSSADSSAVFLSIADGVYNSGVRPFVRLTGSVADLAGNVNTNDNGSLATDGAPQVLTGLSVAAGSYSGTTPVRIVATFSEVFAPAGVSLQVRLVDQITGDSRTVDLITASDQTGYYLGTLAEFTSTKPVLEVVSFNGNVIKALDDSFAIAGNGLPLTGVTFDYAAPSLSSITSTSPDGNYKVGDIVNLTLGFTEPVYLSGTGTPQLTVWLNVDGSNQVKLAPIVITKAALDGKKTVSVSYVIAATDFTANTRGQLRVTNVQLSGGAYLSDAANQVAGSNSLNSVGALANRDINVNFSGLFLLDRQTADLDGDGFIDHVKLTFNKDIKDSTVRASDFVLTGATGLFVATDVNGPATDVADDNVLYLGFADHVLATDAVPTVKYTTGTLADAFANLLPSDSAAVAVLDEASPVVMKVTSTNAASVYKTGDLITLQVKTSEAVTVDTTAGAPTLAIELIPAQGAIQAVTKTARFIGIDSTSTILTFEYRVGLGDTSAGRGIHVSSISVLPVDANKLALGAFPVRTDANALPNQADIRVEAAGPAFANIKTIDENGDGYIDGVRITFNQGIEDTTVAVAAFDIRNGSEVASNLTWSSTWGGHDAPNDEVIIIKFKDGVWNSGITPVVSYNASGGLLKDLSGLPMPADSRRATDGAKPVVWKIAALTPAGTYQPGANLDIAVTFSEPVKQNGSSVLTINGMQASLSTSRQMVDGQHTNTLYFRHQVADGDPNGLVANIPSEMAPSAIVDEAGQDRADPLPLGNTSALSASLVYIGDSSRVIQTIGITSRPQVGDVCRITEVDKDGIPTGVTKFETWNYVPVLNAAIDPTTVDWALENQDINGLSIEPSTAAISYTPIGGVGSHVRILVVARLKSDNSVVAQQEVLVYVGETTQAVQIPAGNG